MTQVCDGVNNIIYFSKHMRCKNRLKLGVSSRDTVKHENSIIKKKNLKNKYLKENKSSADSIQEYLIQYETFTL